MQKIITKINYYGCGHCVNNLKLVFKKHKKDKRNFAAGVFLLKHKKYGYTLFDTGYSMDIYNCGIIGKLYNLFNPTFVKREDIIDYKLKEDNINLDEINYIILSHLHPEHIGGLDKFKNAKIIISEKAYKSYLKPKIRELIIKKFIPDWFEDNLIILDDKKLNSSKTKYFDCYDLFEDKSILITNMDGHAYGQICALVNNDIFLGADTCWGEDLIKETDKMKFPATIIQNDYKEYVSVSRKLQQMKKDNIKLLFSHDKYESKEVL